MELIWKMIYEYTINWRWWRCWIEFLVVTFLYVFIRFLLRKLLRWLDEQQCCSIYAFYAAINHYSATYLEFHTINVPDSAVGYGIWSKQVKEKMWGLYRKIRDVCLFNEYQTFWNPNKKQGLNNFPLSKRKKKEIDGRGKTYCCKKQTYIF